MFGYVKIFEDELKVRDFKQFRAYYCGLCRALGKNCSNCSRFGLSYDMVFLAIVLSALDEKEEEFIQKPCFAHPFVKKKSVVQTKALQYCAHMSVILGYLKSLDDWKDEKSIKGLIGLLMYYGAFKKSKKLYTEKYELLKAQIKRLSKLEEENCSSIDETADCFAKMLEILFVPSFLDEYKRELSWLGYNIGRWIYIIDAYDDMEKDFKKKNYNPLILNIQSEAEFFNVKKELSKQFNESLTFTLENAASAYELLKVYKNDEIIRNILYLGLKIKQDNILNKKEEN